MSQERPEFRKIEVGDVEFEAEENREHLGLASFGSEDEFYVLQFIGRVKDEWIEMLEKLGVSFDDYVPYNAFIVKMGFHTIYQVTTIRNVEFIRFITKYISEFKISSRLKGKRGVLPLEEFKSLELVPESIPYDKRGNITVVLHDPVYMSEVTQIIDELEGTIVADGEDFIRFAIDPLPSSIKKIVELKGVKWIEPYVPAKFFLDKAVSITNADTMWDDHNLDGSGQIIAVADTGIDVGVDGAKMHADFRGRFVQIYALGRNNDASDPDGHGTHVAGIVLGNGANSGGDIRGVAHRARLVFQSVMDAGGGLGGLPANLNNLFRPPYNDDARIHNNSWGAAVNGQYDQRSRNVDEFVWDHRDMVIVFAAGNEGTDADSDGIIDLDSMDTPSTAKNCITVGGSENNKAGAPAHRAPCPPNSTWGEFHNPPPNPAPNRFMNTAPIVNDPWANNPEGMMAISSRGPTDDGRIKPDLIAPGSSILSTKSSLAKDNSFWGVSPNPDYMFMGGTSMATPHVSGAVGIVRQYLVLLESKEEEEEEEEEEERKKWRKKVEDLSPTAALIKAVLINGTRRISGQYKPPDPNDAEDHDPNSQGRIPNHSQGFGILDLEQSLFPPDPIVMEIFDGHRLATDETREYQFLVGESAVTFKATLVWTDSPDRRLVNDLDLIVHTPDGKEYHGNFSADQPPGTNIDDTNNIEKVIIEKPGTGIYRIEVIGDNVPKHAPGSRGQDFALVVTGELSATLKAVIEPSEEYPDNPGTLPAPQLCNRSPPYNPIQGDGPLSRGDSRKDLVEHTQQMLVTLGYDLGRTGENEDGVDGDFGDNTDRAVREFQGENEDWGGNTLNVDGLVGPETSDALNRAMVGIWYDEYMTPTELTEDFILITATRNIILDGLSFDPENFKDVKVILKESQFPNTIALYDPSDDPFSFEGEGRFEVLDEEENSLARGSIEGEENIRVYREVTTPFTVELEVDDTFYTFYGEEAEEEEE